MNDELAHGIDQGGIADRWTEQTKLPHFNDDAFIRPQQKRALNRYILSVEVGGQDNIAA